MGWALPLSPQKEPTWTVPWLQVSGLLKCEQTSTCCFKPFSWWVICHGSQRRQCSCLVAKSCVTLRPHELQHARPLCPPLSSRVCSNSCPLSWGCYLTPHPHLLLLLSSVFPSIRVFSNEMALHIGWPKYWSFHLSISPSNEYSGLISFKMDWFDLLPVQGLSRIFFSTTVWKHPFFSAQPSLWFSSHIHTQLLEKTTA